MRLKNKNQRYKIFYFKKTIYKKIHITFNCLVILFSFFYLHKYIDSNYSIYSLFLIINLLLLYNEHSLISFKAMQFVTANEVLILNNKQLLQGKIIYFRKNILGIILKLKMKNKKKIKFFIYKDVVEPDDYKIIEKTVFKHI